MGVDARVPTIFPSLWFSIFGIRALHLDHDTSGYTALESPKCRTTTAIALFQTLLSACR